jgi:hypothetical protein
MKFRIFALCFVIGILAIGCGSKEETPVEAATETMTNVAEDAVDVVEEAVEEAAEEVKESAVAKCLELAAAKNWTDALEPCTKAAEEKPDDLGIRHALQQAKAAAEG